MQLYCSCFSVVSITEILKLKYQLQYAGILSNLWIELIFSSIQPTLKLLQKMFWELTLNYQQKTSETELHVDSRHLKTELHFPSEIKLL